MAKVVLADEAARRQIRDELGRNVLVEAAAGTGKTTSIVERMLALLASGSCKRVSQLAAVTFTRKAAAELRGRFRIAVEQALASEGDSTRVDNLRAALGALEQGTIGTIHSFCAQLLRERPFEAGVDPAFSELDAAADRQLRKQAWGQYLQRAQADGAGELQQLQRVQLRPDQLRDSFERFTDYPDVERWPLPDEALPQIIDLPTVWRALDDYTGRMKRLFPPGTTSRHGTDSLADLYRRLPRVIEHYEDRNDLGRAAELLGFIEGRNKTLVLRSWQRAGFTAEQAKEELHRWQQFHDEVVEPALTAWREVCYRPVMEVLVRAQQTYDRLRSERGLLNYQDLLLRAAQLLRQNEAVRGYFARRYTHLLVDEFQDTDPIQAEIVVWLTAETDESPAQRSSWQRCRPRPGALFVVGDPKQSIYRFRRADIITYNQVKAIIADSGGLLLELCTNFRTRGSVISWINRSFGALFPPANDASPPYVPLVVGRRRLVQASSPDDLNGVWTLRVPKAHSATKESVIAYESARIARTIAAAIDRKQTVARPPRALARGLRPVVRPADFLIVTRKRADLAAYAEALQRYGVPCHVSGGGALSELVALALLHGCLVAVTQPDNPVALVATLRSELFGVSDVQLYAYRKAGGRFSFLEPGVDEVDCAAIEEAFAHLRRFHRWFAAMPTMAAIERVVAELGLLSLSAAQPGGEAEVASLLKALELLRRRERGCDTTEQLVSTLGQLASGEQPHDGVGAVGDMNAVRVMNLHKAKGLEAEVVFLANPTGEPTHRHPVTLHVDRSDEQVRGFMAIHQQRGSVAPLSLALPQRWATLSEREDQFLEAEELRLLYVAATRAGSQLVISTRATHEAASPWKVPLDGARELPDPGEPKQGAPSAEDLPKGRLTAQWGDFKAALADRLDEMRRPTYVELRSTGDDEDDEQQEGGLFVRENAVIPSALAARSARSSRRYRSVPFTQLARDAASRPMVVRGEIVLAFEEENSWVLVVRRDSSDTEREQQRATAAVAAWRQATGDPVSEAVLLDANGLCVVQL